MILDHLTFSSFGVLLLSLVAVRIVSVGFTFIRQFLLAEPMP